MHLVFVLLVWGQSSLYNNQNALRVGEYTNFAQCEEQGRAITAPGTKGPWGYFTCVPANG